MLRKLLETRTGLLSDCEFQEVMVLVTTDIQVNNIGYGQRTILAYVLQVATTTHSLLKKAGRQKGEVHIAADT